MSRPTSVAKRSLTVAGHRTSVSLEEGFWHELRRIADARGESVARLVAEVDRAREGANLSSALRVFVLEVLCVALNSEQNGWPPSGRASPGPAKGKVQSDPPGS